MANMQQSDHCGSVGVEVSVEAFRHMIKEEKIQQ